MTGDRKAKTSRSLANRRRRRLAALVALVLALAPYFLFTAQAFAQTEPPQPGAGLPTGGSGQGPAGRARQTDPTVPDQPYSDADAEVPLVQEIAEQNKDGIIQIVEDQLRGGLGSYNDTYYGLHQWFSDDWVSNLFANIGQLIGKWITEFIEGQLADTVQFLGALLRVFVLNPNIAVNGANSTWGGQGTRSDDISPYIRQAADVMYGIAVDLLLLLFILCIWKYWAEAAWRGGGNLMGAVGRLIFTAGLLMAWPTLYAFEIQITNEMIHAIYFNSADQVMQLHAALASAVKGGLIAGAAGLAHVLAPVAGQVAGGALGAGAGGMVLGTVGGIASFAGLIIFLVLGGILIAELVYMLVLKAIQTAILTAQYMFAPIFLVFFATPDTESVCAGFVRSFVEVSLWTFVWVGLLKILVILLYSDFNPWGKILLAVGILQLMIQVPSFLARAQISPMSDFISAGLITGLLLKGLGSLGQTMGQRLNQGLSYLFSDQYGARGLPKKQEADLPGLATQAQNPELLTQMRAAFGGHALPGQAGTGPGAPPLQRAGNEQDQTGPQLNTPGQQRPLTPEELRRQQELEEQRRQQLAMLQQQQQQAGQNLQTPTGAQPVTPPAGQTGTPQPPLTTPTTPGAQNTPLGAAPTGLQGYLNRALAQPGVQRGNVDPTTTQVPPGAQHYGMIGQPQGPGQEIEGLNEPPPEALKGASMADKFNHAFYKFVQMKSAAVRARTYDNNSIGFSDDGRNYLVGDGMGNLRHMRSRRGASPEEQARLVMVAGGAEFFKEDPEAFDAARQAAIDAGEDEPQGMMERIAAGVLAYNGSTWKQTAAAKTRFQRSLFKHAAAGTQAYVSGQRGNAYTEYLHTRFGDWTPDDDTWATFMMTTGDHPASPWDPRYVPATESLFAVGLPISEENRAAAANPYVGKLPTWQRRNAIPAVSKIAMERAKEQYPNAHPLVLTAAIGRIAAEMSDKEVEAAMDVQVESQGSDVNNHVVSSVSRLLMDGSFTDGAQAYRALRTSAAIIGGFAVPGQRGGRTVHHMRLDAVIPGGGGGVAPTPPNLTPGQLGIAAHMQPPQDEQHWDVIVTPVAGQTPPATQGTHQHVTVNLPGGQTSQQPGNPTVNVHGSGSVPGGSSGFSGQTVHRVDTTVVYDQPGGGQTPPPNASPEQIRSAIIGSGPLGDTGRILAAEHLVVEMHNAGFTEQHMQDPEMVAMAHQVHLEAPHLMHAIPIVDKIGMTVRDQRIAPQQRLAHNVGTVHVIEEMINNGWNLHQIERPAVYAAQAIMQHNAMEPNQDLHIRPTQQVIRQIWEARETFNDRNNPVPADYLTRLAEDLQRQEFERQRRRNNGS